MSIHERTSEVEEEVVGQGGFGTVRKARLREARTTLRYSAPHRTALQCIAIQCTAMLRNASHRLLHYLNYKVLYYAALKYNAARCNYNVI